MRKGLLGWPRALFAGAPPHAGSPTLSGGAVCSDKIALVFFHRRLYPPAFPPPPSPSLLPPRPPPPLPSTCFSCLSSHAYTRRTYNKQCKRAHTTHMHAHATRKRARKTQTCNTYETHAHTTHTRTITKHEHAHTTHTCTHDTATAALLRELVKEMPADKRLSFQTRVANARTKEAVESLMQDYAARLKCLALPHARSREIDLQQVKKVGLLGEAGVVRVRPRG